MIHTWNRICSKLKRLKGSNCKEKEYESKVRECFDYLLDWDDEVNVQVHIPIGSVTTLIPDIIISSGGVYQFVIELKKPTNILTERQCAQLFSYMKQLKLDYGLYVGENIQLYYDNPDDREDPVLIKKFEFEENTSDGQKFVELFGCKTFSDNNLRMYCKEVLAARVKMDELNAEIEELCSKTGEGLVKEFLIGYISKKGYDYNSVEEKLSNICVSINRNINSQGPVGRYDNMLSETYTISSDTEQNRSSKRHWRYIFEGESQKNAGQLAYAIVARFIADNRNLTYDEIVRIIPRCVRRITKEEFLAKKNVTTDKVFDRRWSTCFAPMLTTADNVEFAIHTGWNFWGYGDQRPYNICDLIDFAQQQGYDVREY